MRIEIENCTIEIDENATRAYYAEHPEHYDCECDTCRAFIAHAPDFPAEVKAFFASCGIDDMLFVNEVSPLGADDEDPLFVDGWYHVVGTMEGGEPLRVWYPPAHKRRKFFARLFDKKLYAALLEGEKETENIRESKELEVGPDFSVSFSNHADMLPPDFPEKRIQLAFMTHIPKLKKE